MRNKYQSENRSIFHTHRTVVTKFATLQRKRGIQEVINLGALCALCVQNKNAIVFYLTQRPQRTQNFQSKLRCRWSSRSLRATEVAKETETIGAKTAPARRRALAPSDNSVDSKCNFLTSEIYLQNGKSVYSVDSV